MKLAVKFTLSMTCVLAAALSVGGSLLLWGTFQDSLDVAAAGNAASHRLSCYSLEADYLSLASRGETPTAEHFESYGASMVSYASGERQYLAIRMEDGTQAFSNFSEGFDYAEGLASGEMRYVHDGDGVLGVYMTTLDAGATLYTAYDVSDVFEARSRSLTRFYQMEAGLLAASAAAVWLLSRALTRRLETVSDISRQIAGGAYGVRTHVSGPDEIGALGESFDIMAEKVAEQVDELQLEVQRREDFLGAFSHELKTPMTAIIGYADTLRTVELEPEERSRAAGYIFREAKRVETLSRSLLALMGLGEQETALEPVPLAHVLRGVGVSLAPVLQGVELRFQNPGRIQVMADETLLHDLLYNLIHNAVKAQPKDNTVRVRLSRTADSVNVTVEDTGRGIPKESLHRVTEPFYMVDKSRARKAGGSGMGLALCRRIAECHGTELTFESEEGAGTRVTFSLRIAKEETP